MKKPLHYFEGILQLRSPTMDVLDFVRSEIPKSGRAHIAKEKIVRNGVDFYVSSQHYLQVLGRKLKSKFGGVLDVSCRIQTCSHLTSKDLYRVSVLFVPLKFCKGDVVRFNDSLWRILLVGNQVQLQNVVSGAKKWLKTELVQGLQKIEHY